MLNVAESAGEDEEEDVSQASMKPGAALSGAAGDRRARLGSKGDVYLDMPPASQNLLDKPVDVDKKVKVS